MLTTRAIGKMAKWTAQLSLATGIGLGAANTISYNKARFGAGLKLRDKAIPELISGMPQQGAAVFFTKMSETGENGLKISEEVAISVLKHEPADEKTSAWDSLALSSGKAGAVNYISWKLGETHGPDRTLFSFLLPPQYYRFFPFCRGERVLINAPVCRPEFIDLGLERSEAAEALKAPALIDGIDISYDGERLVYDGQQHVWIEIQYNDLLPDLSSLTFSFGRGVTVHEHELLPLATPKKLKFMVSAQLGLAAGGSVTRPLVIRDKESGWLVAVKEFMLKIEGREPRSKTAGNCFDHRSVGSLMGFIKAYADTGSLDYFQQQALWREVRAQLGGAHWYCGAGGRGLETTLKSLRVNLESAKQWVAGSSAEVSMRFPLVKNDKSKYPLVWDRETRLEVAVSAPRLDLPRKDNYVLVFSPIIRPAYSGGRDRPFEEYEFKARLLPGAKDEIRLAALVKPEPLSKDAYGDYGLVVYFVRENGERVKVGELSSFHIGS